MQYRKSKQHGNGNLQSKTPEHVALQRLENANQELLKVNEELHMARDLAIEASNMKSTFVANISHELRTPLSGVISLNELLLESDLTLEQQELAKSVQGCARSLLAIVNDILDLSKMEAGKIVLDIAAFNIISLAEDVCRLLAESAKRKGLILRMSVAGGIPKIVVGDPIRVRQVLLNLIGNAIKFTEEGEVVVNVSSETAETRSLLSFSITDTGIGIGDEERRFLFQPFSQVDNSNTRKYGGTGLGLSITKRLVDLMSGEIGVDSRKGVGSTFWVRIPFCKESAASNSDSEGQLLPTGQRLPADKHVLVAEDNALIRLIAVKQLRHLGLNVHTVINGRDAVESVRACHYDVILMDCQMPEMDGYEATRAIRAMESGTGMRSIIIAMTASAMAGDREKCLASGMDDYLSKPITIDHLAEKLATWFASTEQNYFGASPSNRQLIF